MNLFNQSNKTSNSSFIRFAVTLGLGFSALVTVLNYLLVSFVDFIDGPLYLMGFTTLMIVLSLISGFLIAKKRESHLYKTAFLSSFFLVGFQLFERSFQFLDIPKDTLEIAFGGHMRFVFESLLILLLGVLFLFTFHLLGIALYKVQKRVLENESE